MKIFHMSPSCDQPDSEKHKECIGVFDGKKCECPCHWTYEDLKNSLMESLVIVVIEDTSEPIDK